MKKAKSLGEELRLLRENAGLGIKTVGKQADVSFTHISKVENGHKQPSEELIAKLATVYGVHREELLAKMGALPPDIQEIVRNQGEEVFKLIRQAYGEGNKSKK